MSKFTNGEMVALNKDIKWIGLSGELILLPKHLAGVANKDGEYGEKYKVNFHGIEVFIFGDNLHKAVPSEIEFTEKWLLVDESYGLAEGKQEGVLHTCGKDVYDEEKGTIKLLDCVVPTYMNNGKNFQFKYAVGDRVEVVVQDDKNTPYGFSDEHGIGYRPVNLMRENDLQGTVEFFLFDNKYVHKTIWVGVISDDDGKCVWVPASCLKLIGLDNEKRNKVKYEDIFKNVREKYSDVTKFHENDIVTCDVKDDCGLEKTITGVVGKDASGRLGVKYYKGDDEKFELYVNNLKKLFSVGDNVKVSKACRIVRVNKQTYKSEEYSKPDGETIAGTLSGMFWEHDYINNEMILMVGIDSLFGYGYNVYYEFVEGV